MKHDLCLLSGISSVMVLFFIIAFSSLLTPNYDFVNQYLSELSTREYGFVFNTGLIISAILLVPFFLGLRKYLGGTLVKTGIAFGLLSAPVLASIAIFIGGNPMHLIVTSLFFTLILLTTLFLSYSIQHTKIKIFGFSVVLLGVLFGYMYFAGYEAQWLQKIVVFGYLIWIICISIDNSH